MNSMEGKVVWITGASSGIGKELAGEFARAGSRLILSSRNLEKLEQVRSSLQLDDNNAQLLPLDLENPEDLPAKTREAVNLYGSIDILINNAGIGLRDFALDTDLKVDKKLMDINYFGSIVLAKKVLPEMLKRKSGQVVVVSSLSGKYGVPRTSAYAASKHALHGFFETLRSEIAGSGIDITIVVPGIIQTNITAHALKGDGKSFEKVEETFRQAYPPDKAARKIYKAILARKEEVFVGGSEGITLWINRFAPRLLRRLIRSHPIKKLRRLKEMFAWGKKI